MFLPVLKQQSGFESNQVADCAAQHENATCWKEGYDFIMKFMECGSERGNDKELNDN